MGVFTFDHHALIMGKTSSGKTYLARHLFEVCPVRAIYWNRQMERGFKAREVRRWDPRLLERPGSKVNLIPPTSTDESFELLGRIQRDLFRIGAKVARDRAPLVVFFHDEPDKEAPAHDKESGAYEIAVRGNRHGVKYVGITQRPSQLSKSVRANCTTTVLFAMTAEEEHFLRRENVPDDVFRWVAWDTHEGRARPTYRFAMNQGAGWVKHNPMRV